MNGTQFKHFPQTKKKKKPPHIHIIQNIGIREGVKICMKERKKKNFGINICNLYENMLFTRRVQIIKIKKKI